jgi:hypothetical protein
MVRFSFPVQVNEYAARMVACCVAVALTVAYFMAAPWILPVLAVGFVLRVCWGPRFSPLARLAMAVAPRLREPHMVTGAPKRFAQAIGALCTIAATGAWATGHLTAAWAIAGLVVVFATLEASIAFCMGCWVYRRLQLAGVFAPDVCVDCVARTTARRPTVPSAIYSAQPEPQQLEPSVIVAHLASTRARTSPSELSGL